VMSLPALIAAALIAGLALGGTAAWRVQTWRWAAADAERVQATQEAARLQSAALAKSTERIDHDTHARLRRAAAAAAAAGADLERLRAAAGALAVPIAPGAAGPACQPDDGRLGRLAGLLVEGAELAAEGGRRVEQLAAEKAGLQRDAAEIRRVFVTP